MKRKDRDKFVVEVSRYVIKNKTTVRKAAQIFNISKSTVHNYLTRDLPKLDPVLAEAARELLDTNYSVKHIRGGMATKRKFNNLTA